MKNPKEPIPMIPFLGKVPHLYTKPAREAFIAAEGEINTFDEFRTKLQAVPKNKLALLSPAAHDFLTRMYSGQFDGLLSQEAYDKLHPANSQEVKQEVIAEKPSTTSSPVHSSPTSPPSEQPRSTSLPSHLEKELTTPTLPAEEAQAKVYSQPTKDKTSSLLDLSESLRSSESPRNKRTADLLGKLSAKFSVSNLPDLTAKKIGVDDLADAGFDSVERNLLKDYLDDHRATIRPTLRLHPHNLTHRIADDTIKRDVESFVLRHRIDTIEKLASIPYSNLLEWGLSTQGAMALSSVLETHYKTEIGSVKFNEANRPARAPIPQSNPQPSAPSVPKPVSARPLFASPLSLPKPHPTYEPEADTPLVANPNYDKPVALKPTQKPIDRSGLPSYILSMSAADVTTYMSDVKEKASMQSALARLSFPCMDAVVKMSNERLISAGATPEAVSAFRRAIGENFLNVKEVERQQETIFRNYSSGQKINDSVLEINLQKSGAEHSSQAEPQEELRGYSVVKQTHDLFHKSVIVNGLEIKIKGRADQEKVYSTFLLHSEGKSIKEIKEALGWANENNIMLWLRRGKVMPEYKPQENSNDVGSAYLLAHVFSTISAAHRENRRAPPLNPLSNMPSLGSLSYKSRGKK